MRCRLTTTKRLCTSVIMPSATSSTTHFFLLICFTVWNFLSFKLSRKFLNLFSDFKEVMQCRLTITSKPCISAASPSATAGATFLSFNCFAVWNFLSFKLYKDFLLLFSGFKEVMQCCLTTTRRPCTSTALPSVTVGATYCFLLICFTV